MLKVFKFGAKRKKRAEEAGGEAAPQPAGSGHLAGKEAAVAGSTVPTLDLNLPSPSFAADNSKELQNTPSKASLWVDATPSAMGDTSSTSDGTPSQTNGSVSQKHPSNLKRSATVTVRAKAKLSTPDIASLLDACLPHLKARGLGELGLFRPYRWAEDASHQRRMIDLFLRSVRSDIAKSERHDVDENSEEARIADAFWEAGHKPADLLARELEYAQGHDLAGVIKWGLRHLHSSLQEPPASGGQTCPSRLAAAVPSMESAQGNSYGEVLKTLGEPEVKLLDSLMDLVASVAAYAEVNAMSATRICKVFGFWVLAPRSTNYTSYQHFYSTWQQCVDLFERIFIAYLHSRSDLPGRLQQILHRAKAGQHDVHDQAALHANYCLPPSDAFRTADITPSANGQHGGSHARGRRGRSKSSASVFNSASKAASSTTTEQASDALASEWWQIVTSDVTAAADEDGIYGKLLAEETARIIAMVDPPPEASSKAGAVSPSTLPEPESPTRRRSMSVDSPQRPNASFRNPSEFHHGKDSSAQSASPYLSDSSKLPSWNDFVSGGFDSAVVKKSITLNLEPTNPAAREELSKSQSSLKRSTSKGSRGRGATDAAQYPRNATSNTGAASSTQEQPRPQPQLMTVNFISVEDVFADVFLDALPEVELRSKWPTFAIGQLRKPLGAHRTEANQTKWLVVEEVEAPQPPEPAPAAPEPVRAASPTRSAKSATSTAKREKRPFLGFGRRGNSKTVSVFGQSKKSFSEPSQQSSAKTSTPPSQMPSIEQSPPAAKETASEAQEAPREHGSPLAALKSGHHSSKSSLSSIRRVKPPSVDALYPTSTKTNTEVSSTVAVHEKSQDVSRPVSMDATEVLDDAHSRHSPIEQAAEPEQVSEVTSASPNLEVKEPGQESVVLRGDEVALDSRPTESASTAIGSQPTPPLDTAQTAAAEVELVASPHEPTKPVQVSPTSQVADLPRDRTASKASAASRSSLAKAPVDNSVVVDLTGTSATVSTTDVKDSSPNAEASDSSSPPPLHIEADAEPVGDRSLQDQGGAPQQVSQKGVEPKPEADSNVQQADARAELKSLPTYNDDAAQVETEKAEGPQAAALLTPEAAISGADAETARIDVTRPSQDTVREETTQPAAAAAPDNASATHFSQSSPPTTPQQLQPESPSQLQKSQSSESVALAGTDQGSSPSGSPQKSKKLLAGAKKMMSSPFRKNKKEREPPSPVQSEKARDPDIDKSVTEAPVTPVSDSAHTPAQAPSESKTAEAHMIPARTEAASVQNSPDMPAEASPAAESEAQQMPVQSEPATAVPQDPEEHPQMTKNPSPEPEQHLPSPDRDAAGVHEDSTPLATSQVPKTQPDVPASVADEGVAIEASHITENDQPHAKLHPGDQTSEQRNLENEDNKPSSLLAGSTSALPAAEQVDLQDQDPTVKERGTRGDDAPAAKDQIDEPSAGVASNKPPYDSPELQSDAETQFATPFDTPGGLNEPTAELSVSPDTSKPATEAAQMPAATPAPESDHARTQQ